MTIGPFSTAVELLAARRDGEVSATELLEMYRSRIAAFNETLRAIVIPNDEAADARAADVDRHPGSGALEGLPLTIKDCIDVAGLRTTAGVEALRDNVPSSDSPLAAAVLDAGAVLIGKTNVPPYAEDWQASNPIFGRTVNPWDPRRTPGGSTGGGAAALAAGLAALEFGSDIGGSIRFPAACCGVYGHRPSDSLVPRSGHVPGPAAPVPGAIMGVLGPLARSAEDLELALDVITGPEPGEERWTITLPRARGRSLEDLRVALLPPLDAAPVDDCVASAMETVAEAVGRAGASPQVAGPEIDWTAMVDTYRTLLATMVFAQLTPAARDELASALESAGDEFERGTIAGLRLLALDFSHVLVERERVRRAWAAFFEEWDVVVAPITLGPPFEHTDAPWSERIIVVNGQHIPYGRQVVPAAVATLPGLPATVFPVTRTSVDGVELPIGLQVIGPYLEDRTPIRFAALLAKELGGFVPPPGYGEQAQ